MAGDICHTSGPDRHSISISLWLHANLILFLDVYLMTAPHGWPLSCLLINLLWMILPAVRHPKNLSFYTFSCVKFHQTTMHSLTGEDIYNALGLAVSGA